MAVPGSSDARLFYRCAVQRFEEAEVLLNSKYTTGAVYLAGYGVECMLKALVLMTVPARIRSDTMKSFRGAKDHEYDWLRKVYLLNGGARFPRGIRESFGLVDVWSTDLRYVPRTLHENEAKGFIAATAAIMQWVDGRI